MDATSIGIIAGLTLLLLLSIVTLVHLAALHRALGGLENEVEGVRRGLPKEVARAVETTGGDSRAELNARLVALEDRLGELPPRIEKLDRGETLDDLVRRFEALSGSVEEFAGRETKLPDPPKVKEEVEPLLVRLREELEAGLSERDRQREEAERERAEQEKAEQEKAEREPTPAAEDLRDIVERVLADRGFRGVEILEGPVPDGDRERFLVEARRDGMTFKGSVFAEGGRVVEQRMASSHTMFP